MLATTRQAWPRSSRISRRIRATPIHLIASVILLAKMGDLRRSDFAPIMTCAALASSTVVGCDP